MTQAFIQRVRDAFMAGDANGAERMVRERLEGAPDDREARIELARLLRARGAIAEALGALDQAGEDAVPLLRASILTRLGRHEEAIAAQRLALCDEEHPRALLGLTHLLKTVGNIDEAEQASRRALAIDPALAEAWWSLSSLKTMRFTRSDREAMQGLLDDPRTTAGDRVYLHFALTRALDAVSEAEESWRHLAEGNRLRAAEAGHRPEDVSVLVDSTIATMDEQFFADRAGWDDPATGPIFVLGMPRSGSTLLEQMLASHTAIEGVSELPYLPALARQLGKSNTLVGPAYLAQLSALGAGEVRALGEAYLRSAQAQRRTARPYFVDKMPNNWLFAGLIRTILPNARIIDIRRNPMDCGLSNFRELFARGQTYSYDLAHIGRYYADYLRLMRHFDRVIPGAVHRIIYEDLVDDPEGQLHGLFDYLQLPFEPSVLDFHKTDRGVRTASAAQVRQPLNRKGIGRWQAYDQWLGPLRTALGAELTGWRD